MIRETRTQSYAKVNYLTKNSLEVMGMAGVDKRWSAVVILAGEDGRWFSVGVLARVDRTWSSVEFLVSSARTCTANHLPSAPAWTSLGDQVRLELQLMEVGLLWRSLLKVTEGGPLLSYG
jgi:hypothetical protein